MKRFLKLYSVEQKLAFRSLDILIFGIIMPVGILLLITMIAGDKQAGNSGATYLETSYASLIAVGICASAFMGIPLTIADYRDKKILKHFYVTPCSPVWILGADILCSAVNSVLSAIAVTLTAVLVFNYQMKGNLFLFIGSWLLTLVSMFSIGLLMASLCRSVKSTNAVTSLVYFPMLFLSGATIPYELFPAGLQKVASVMPLTQGIKLMKAASMGQSVEAVSTRMILLLVICIVCSIISVKTFKWE